MPSWSSSDAPVVAVAVVGPVLKAAAVGVPLPLPSVRRRRRATGACGRPWRVRRLLRGCCCRSSGWERARRDMASQSVPRDAAGGRDKGG
eukprot:scaffold3551_cov408-Prasinococcus_capsulatus_cf.AAC.30